MMSSGVNLVMTVIGFAVSTMFIVFVCTRLICARIQLHHNAPSSSSSRSLHQLERGFHEPAVLASTFPTKKFSDDFFSSLEDAQCTVCLSEYDPDDMLRLLPYCGHSFHVSCIDLWLLQHSTCPICRVSLRDLPDKKRLLMHPLFSSPTYPTSNSNTADSLAMQSYHRLLTGHAHAHAHAYSYSSSSRHSEINGRRRGMDPIEEDHCAAAAATTETNASPQVQVRDNDKHVESPSNQ